MTTKRFESLWKDKLIKNGFKKRRGTYYKLLVPSPFGIKHSIEVDENFVGYSVNGVCVKLWIATDKKIASIL